MTRARLLAYCRSREHLVGCCLALFGAALAFLDPVGWSAIVLVLGFYGVGVAAGRASEPQPFGFDPARADVALVEAVARISDRVPADVLSQLCRIRDIIRLRVLPAIELLPLGSLDRYLAERTTVEYLPSALEQYLAVGGDDASWASTTAARILSDELCLMETDIQRIAGVIERTSLDRMRNQHRFLNERLGQFDGSG